MLTLVIMQHKSLTTEQEITAYIHRTRMQMLGVLKTKPATLTMIGRKLGVHPANLTRHIRILEKAGLVVLKEKRDTGRNLEKWYAATAASFDVAPEADELSAPHKVGLQFLRSDLSAALAQIPDENPGTVQTLVAEARLTKDQIAEFVSEITRLAKRFEAVNTKQEGRPYHLSLALYPVVEVEGSDSEERIVLRREKAK